MEVVRKLYGQLTRLLDLLAPLGDLLIRLWVANVFLKSGLTKIDNWDSTLYLFSNEYHVPLLPPELAAYAGTFIELCFPVLLALGLGTRVTALVLFVFNIMAVISYPGLEEVGIKDHQYWGLLMLVPLLHGAGKLSLDYLFQKRLERQS
jgi:putative oxidoreductase